MRPPDPPDTAQIREITSPEERGGNMQGDPDNNKTGKTEYEAKLSPKPEETAGPQGGVGDHTQNPTPFDLTASRVTSWAGRTDKVETREPLPMHIKSLSELSTAGANAACIQAVHDIPS